MINIGVIGAGQNAAGHVRYYAQNPRAKVICIADPALDRAQSLAGSCGARAVADYRSFLDSVDAVIITSPNFLHAEQAVTCAAAGKHIYCEKPMGLSLSDARHIAAAVKEAKVASQIGFSVRFTPEARTMQRVANSGELGKIVSVCSRRLMYINPAGEGWRADQRLSGGLLYEINIHELDWMMAVGGPVRSVFARTWTAEPSIAQSPRSNDQLWITLQFASGATGMHEGSWISPIPCFYRSVQGTQAGMNTSEWGDKLYHANSGENRTDVVADPPFDLRDNFLDAIEQRGPATADVQWGIKVMAVAEAVIESAERGIAVEPSY